METPISRSSSPPRGAAHDRLGHVHQPLRIGFRADVRRQTIPNGHAEPHRRQATEHLALTLDALLAALPNVRLRPPRVPPSSASILPPACGARQARSGAATAGTAALPTAWRSGRAFRALGRQGASPLYSTIGSAPARGCRRAAVRRTARARRRRPGRGVCDIWWRRHGRSRTGISAFVRFAPPRRWRTVPPMARQPLQSDPANKSPQRGSARGLPLA